MEEMDEVWARIAALNAVVTELVRLARRSDPQFVDTRLRAVRIEAQEFRVDRTDYEGNRPDMYLRALDLRQELLENATAT